MVGAPVCGPRVNMSVLRLLFPDQLSRNLSALQDLDPKRDLILMAETHAEATYVKHHQQKLVLLFSAMRHFAQSLKAEQCPLLYVEYEDPANTGNLMDEVRRVFNTCNSRNWWSRHRVNGDNCNSFKIFADEERCPWRSAKIPVFSAQVSNLSTGLRDPNNCEWNIFTREMRKQTGMLMQDQTPVGGKWNYDSENRKTLPSSIAPPALERFAPDSLTQSVIALVQRHFSDHFGQLDNFGWAATREQALIALDFFVKQALPGFGDYQDASNTLR